MVMEVEEEEEEEEEWGDRKPRLSEDIFRRAEDMRRRRRMRRRCGRNQGGVGSGQRSQAASLFIDFWRWQEGVKKVLVGAV